MKKKGDRQTIMDEFRKKGEQKKMFALRKAKQHNLKPAKQHDLKRSGD